MQGFLKCVSLLFFFVRVLSRLLHTQVAFCCFTEANKSQTEANEIIDNIGIDKVPINLLVTYYKVLSMLYFAKSEYNLSYDWSVKALELIGPTTPDKYVNITSLDSHHHILTSLIWTIYMHFGRKLFTVCLFAFLFIQPHRIAIDVLRVAAKACVVKREFDKARILILKAVKMAG